MSKSKHHQAEEALLIQKHQLDSLENKTLEIASGVQNLNDIETKNLDAVAALNAQLDSLIESSNLDVSDLSLPVDFNTEELFSEAESRLQAKQDVLSIQKVAGVDYSEDMSWESYLGSVHLYAEEHGIDLTQDPFARVMSDSQKSEISKRIDEDLTYKNANCDKYDYAIAAVCGAIGGIIDVAFVGLPGSDSFINQSSDDFIDKAVQKFAELNGWNGPSGNTDPTKSAIRFLEGRFKVNYDQRSSVDVDRKFKMNTFDHHIKSLAHSPDVVGLFFSILAQFTSTAHFVSDGKLITIDTKTFELQGKTFVAKLYCGFMNWLGHLFSDMAGSGTSENRGMGIPLPFYSLLQFAKVGEFGENRLPFSEIAIKVFESGYELRHGVAMAIPVVVVELMTRMMWVVKQRTYHKKDWSECIPSTQNPELRRMLLVSHGVLCLVDAVDAGVRGAGNPVAFLVRTNMIAWARFGFSAAKEMNAWYWTGRLDIEAANEELDREYERLLGLTAT